MTALRVSAALSTLFLAGLTLSGCTGKGGPPQGTSSPESSPRAAEAPVRLQEPAEDLNGLEFTLSEVPRPAPDGAGAPLADASPLSSARVQKLLDRAGPLERAERTEFNLRKQSPPPPRPGEEVQEQWPPDPSAAVAPDTDPGALTVRRFAPEGEVPMAPHVSVTFSQPMIAVTSQDQASQTVPVTLDPQPQGSWRWLGTRTVLFDPDPRLPMATEYTATIPAGTSSALGVTLDEDVSFTFATPAVQLDSAWPSGDSVPVDTLVMLRFDQQVEPAEILPFVSVRGGGDVSLRQATPAEIEANEQVQRMVEQAQDGRYLVLAPQGLEPATSYTIRLDEGAPSAEGPRLTPSAQTRGFRTYDPLRVEDRGCWEVGGGCNPDGQLWVRTNNSLADDAVDHISVEPEIPGLVVNASGSWVNIRGQLPARKSVTVRFDEELTDVFGQRLGKDWSHDFDIGPARPLLMGPGKEQVVLDPAGPPVFSVYTRNLDQVDVQIYRVGPDELGRMATWAQQNRWRTDDPEPAPLRPIFDDTVKIDAAQDELVETGIDLAPHLQDGSGQFFVVATTPRRTRREDRARLTAWVQRTRLGVTAFHDAEVLKAWVTDLQTGAPVQGAQVQLVGASQGAATTNADGLATLAPYGASVDVAALTATHGKDTAVLTAHSGLYLRNGFRSRPVAEQLRWVVFDDRGMYKPGESARFKGFVRPFLARPGEGLRPMTTEAPLTWTAVDAQGAEIATGTTTIAANGSFDLTIEDLGESPNLGMATLRLRAGWRGSESHAHRFQIQEFRRPEFEVTTSVDPRPYVLGQHAIATAEASYYAGGGLPAAPVTWQVTASPGSWRPPGWKDFTFGTWIPWWRHRGGPSGGTTSKSLQAQTGADGSHSVRMDFLAMQPPRPTSIRAQATVVDVNRQRWSSASTFLVHPADRYVGLQVERAFVEKGKAVEVKAVVVDLDGEAVSGSAIELALKRLVWKRVKGQWTEVEEDGPTCSLTSSADDPVSCELTPELGGSWRLTADITDAEGRANRSTRQIWVSGASSTRPQRGVEQQDVVLVPDRESPQVGDTVEILVQSPFFPAEGLVTLRQDGLMSTERITLDGPSTTLSIPIEERHLPTLYVEVDLVGQTARTDDEGEPLEDTADRVAYAHGGLTLKIPPLSRTLDVQVEPAKDQVRPGASTHVDVSVTDADGRPVNDAEVVVWMVDEAVLALSGYQTPDPLAVFYADRGNGVSAAHLRSRVVLVDPEAIRGQLGQQGAVDADGFGAGGGGRGQLKDMEVLSRAPRGRSSRSGLAASADMPVPSAPMEEAKAEAEPLADEPRGGERSADTTIEVRTDFRALAVFAPRLSTGPDGTVRVPVDLPDSLTRYRVMAVAADPGVRFGHGDATLTARQPLMLRPSPPRFLNVGDKAELPLVVQNPTERPVTVDLALEVDNAKVLDNLDVDVLTAPDRTRGGLTFTIPAEDRREVRLPVGVIDAGTLRFQAVIASNDATDAATDELPVWTPATTEAFATYGSLTQGGIRQPIQAPDDAWSAYGGLEITTSSTQLQALTDALVYLNGYPFACTEQVSSRVLANAALYPVLDAFAAEQLPSAEAMKAGMEEDLELLARRQRRSGGFSYWGRSDDVYPYPSLHAVHALVRARDRGWEGDPQVLERGLRYAEQIERHIPPWYSENARRTIRAYAVFVRHRAGDSDRGQARQLASFGTDGLSLEAQGWIVPVLHATGQQASVQTFLRHWDNRAVETAAAATFQASYTDTNDYVLLHGSRRTDAVLLESLLEVHPRHDLNEKIVVGLLGHRREGRWSSTQENSFVLLALHRYFNEYEGVTPDFIARAWLDDGFAGEHAFEGRTTERSHIDVPMAWLQEGDETHQLVLAKEGEGRLYYRIGLRYAPRDLQLEPADHGFAVERTYEAVDDADDVRQDPDGTWRVKAGAQVRVRVSMVAESRRTMVALVDPLPGGFEPLNPALAVTGTIPADPQAGERQPYWWWSRPWYNHQNLRDERAEAFTDLLWAGVHEYTYVAVATTPGRFVVPPPKAEEMYHPETFGRGASARVIIE